MLDASAIIAIIIGETGSAALLERLVQSETLVIGAPTALECTIVLARRGAPDPEAEVNTLLQSYGVQVVAFTDRHTRVATAAYLQFGKGRHPAKLNFGDCMSYAVAKVAREPLLYIGDD
ncbi:MAG TPA: type II toxin-antitoxin system VapC family toxin, partial [Bryobacteraceae bacterium]